MKGKNTDNLVVNKDLEGLLKNFAEALKVYTIKELKDAMTEVLNKRSPKEFDTEFVIKSVCDQYEITKRILLQTKARGGDGEIQLARVTIYALLHYELAIPVRSIAIRIFNRYPNTVTQGLKMFKGMEPEKFKSDAIFMETYNKLKEKIANHILNGNKS